MKISPPSLAKLQLEYNFSTLINNLFHFSAKLLVFGGFAHPPTEKWISVYAGEVKSHFCKVEVYHFY